jgi:uncharacterized protein
MGDDRAPDPNGKLDETIEQSFPASDPPANTVETGIRIGRVDSPAPVGVHDNVGAQRFEIRIGDEVAFLRYEKRHNAFILVHTEVPSALRGHGLANRLAKAGLAAARASGLHVIVICPMVRAYMRRHRDA